MAVFIRSTSVKDRCKELEKKLNFEEKAPGSQQNNDQHQDIVSSYEPRPEPKAKPRLEPKVELEFNQTSHKV